MKVYTYNPCKRTSVNNNQEDCNMRSPTEFWGNNTESNPILTLFPQLRGNREARMNGLLSAEEDTVFLGS